VNLHIECLLFLILCLVSCLSSNLCSWGRERYVAETKLTQGMKSFGSTRGVSGHVQNPFAGNVAVFYFIFVQSCMGFAFTIWKIIYTYTTYNFISCLFVSDKLSSAIIVSDHNWHAQRDIRRGARLLFHLQRKLSCRR